MNDRNPPYCGSVGELRALLAELPDDHVLHVLAYGDVVDGDTEDLRMLDGTLYPLRRLCRYRDGVAMLVDLVDGEHVGDPFRPGEDGGDHGHGGGEVKP